MFLGDIKNRVQKQYSEDYSLAALRTIIIAWCIFIIVLALIIDNKVVLSGILAYEILP